jgi:hypothetical protein
MLLKTIPPLRDSFPHNHSEFENFFSSHISFLKFALPREVKNVETVAYEAVCCIQAMMQYLNDALVNFNSSTLKGYKKLESTCKTLLMRDPDFYQLYYYLSLSLERQTRLTHDGEKGWELASDALIAINGFLEKEDQTKGDFYYVGLYLKLRFNYILGDFDQLHQDVTKYFIGYKDESDEEYWTAHALRAIVNLKHRPQALMLIADDFNKYLDNVPARDCTEYEFANNFMNSQKDRLSELLSKIQKTPEDAELLFSIATCHQALGEYRLMLENTFKMAAVAHKNPTADLNNLKIGFIDKLTRYCDYNQISCADGFLHQLWHMTVKSEIKSTEDLTTHLEGHRISAMFALISSYSASMNNIAQCTKTILSLNALLPQGWHSALTSFAATMAVIKADKIDSNSFVEHERRRAVDVDGLRQRAI